MSTQWRDGGRSRLVGNSDIFKLLPDGLAFEQLNLSKQFLKQQGRPNLARYDCVLNLVSEADHSPNTLEALQLLDDAAQAATQGMVW